MNYPTHGPGRINNKLAVEDLIISPGGVYNILKEKRKRLKHRLDRLHTSLNGINIEGILCDILDRRV